MNLKRFLKEVLYSDYYRNHPLEIIKFALSKVIHKINSSNSPDEIFEKFGLDKTACLQGIEKYQGLFQELIQKDKMNIGIPFEVGIVLYGIVRSTQPEIVIETGIAGGVSSTFIICALLENNKGILFSIDLPPDDLKRRKFEDGSNYNEILEKGIGYLIPSEIKRYIGDRHKIILGDVKSTLPGLLKQLGKIDLFIHDDLHLPDHMLWEYELVWEYIKPKGFLMSDDINYGWVKFMQRNHIKNYVNIKRFGIIRKQ